MVSDFIQTAFRLKTLARPKSVEELAVGSAD